MGGLGQEGGNEHSGLDYCGSAVVSTVNKEGSIVRRKWVLNALSGRRKIAQRVLNDKVIVLRRTKLHNFILRSPSQYDPTSSSSKNSHREHSIPEPSRISPY